MTLFNITLVFNQSSLGQVVLSCAMKSVKYFHQFYFEFMTYTSLQIHLLKNNYGNGEILDKQPMDKAAGGYIIGVKESLKKTLIK